MDLTRFVLPLILLILTFAAGFWVSRSGKPYKAAIFNIHKLLALAAVIFATIVVVNLLKISTHSSLVITLFVLSGVSVIALFATGALLSAQKTISKTWQLLHHIVPYLLVCSVTAAILFLK
jgi:hypothetical protein